MRKILVTLALVVALVLGMATTAMAAVPGIKSSDELLGTFAVAGQEAWIKLDWIGDPPTTASIDSPFTMTATATNNHGLAIERTLYIIEIMKGATVATVADVTMVAEGEDGAGNPTIHGVPVPHSELGGDYWFFGTTEAGGFTFEAGKDATTTFTITFHTVGSYSYTIYAVQLPEPE